MKRIGAAIGFSLLFSTLFAFYLGKTVAEYGLFALVLFLPTSILISKNIKHYGLTCITAFSIIGVAVCLLYTAIVVEPIKEYNDRFATIRATVMNENRHSDSVCSLNLHLTQIDSEQVSVDAVLNTTFPLEVIYGESIEFDAELKYIESSIDQTKGVFLKMYTGNDFTYRVISKGNDLRYFPQRLSYLMSKSMLDNMSDDDGVVCTAISMGDTSHLSGELKGLFKKAGIMHFLVVSGLHMAIVYGVCDLLLSNLFRRKKYSYTLTALVVLMFMFMTGFSFSAARSGAMLIIMLLIKAASYSADSINSMGVALTLIYIGNPYSLANVGLLMSVFSTAGVILIWKPLNAHILARIRRDRIFLRYFAVQGIFCIVAITSALPIYILFFRRVSFAGLLGNILLFPVMKLLLYCTLAGSLMNVGGFVYISRLMLRLCECMADIILITADNVGKIPHSTVYVAGRYFVIWFVVTAVLSFGMYKLSKRSLKKKLLRTAVCSLCLAVLLYCFNYIYTCDKTMLTISGSQVLTVRKNGVALIVPLCTYPTEMYIYEPYDPRDKYTVLSADQNQLDTDTVKCLAKELELSRILLYGCADEEYSVPQTEISESRTFDLGEFRVSYILSDNKKYTYIQTENSTLLIMPYMGDCKNLDSSWLSSDVVVTGNSLKNSNRLDCRLAVVLYGDEENLLEINCDSVYNTDEWDYLCRLEDWNGE